MTGYAACELENLHTLSLNKHRTIELLHIGWCTTFLN